MWQQQKTQALIVLIEVFWSDINDYCNFLVFNRQIITDENGIAYHKFKYFVTKIPTIDEANPVQRYTCVEKEFECLIPVNQTLTTGVVTPEIQYVFMKTIYN